MILQLAHILCRAALSDEFAGMPQDDTSIMTLDYSKVSHNDALDPIKNRKLVEVIERMLQQLSAEPHWFRQTHSIMHA